MSGTWLGRGGRAAQAMGRRPRQNGFVFDWRVRVALISLAQMGSFGKFAVTRMGDSRIWRQRGSFASSYSMTRGAGCIRAGASYEKQGSCFGGPQGNGRKEPGGSPGEEAAGWACHFILVTLSPLSRRFRSDFRSRWFPGRRPTCEELTGTRSIHCVGDTRLQNSSNSRVSKKAVALMT